MGGVYCKSLVPGNIFFFSFFFSFFLIEDIAFRVKLVKHSNVTITWIVVIYTKFLRKRIFPNSSTWSLARLAKHIYFFSRILTSKR